VAAILAYRGGVLCGFSNCDNDPKKHRLHLSQDGKKLGEGLVPYEGVSPVRAMITFVNHS
jgi:hypothetical protein